MTEAASADAQQPPAPEAQAEARGWPLRRYLLLVAGVSALALAALAWARPSMFTGIVAASGHGHRVAQVDADSFYAQRVDPLLQAQCAGCHGPRLQRARLRLDTLGDLRLGGKSGPVVVAGNAAASELYRRLLLPKGDKRAMPAGSKPPLSRDEIRTIELWIASGADGRVAAAAIANAPPPPPKPVVFAAIDPAAAQRARAPLAQSVQALSARYPDAITYLARDGAALSFNARRLGDAFGDADLAQLRPLAAQLVRLDLSGTAITDAAAPALSGFSQLRQLRIGNTGAGDPVLDAAAKLPKLESLAVPGTQATAQRVAALRTRGVRVYDGR
jgi:mono/diheme cytochrome c family protein